jgi:outer membrane protein assembly factor BamB
VTRTLARRLLAALVALAAAGAAGLVGWRVLKPAEVLATAADPYPAPAVRAPGVTGRTAGAPLIVDGRIRVFAAKRQVRADAPVDARTSYTPRWSYRRWPEQLAGVVAVGSTVVSRWSDGKLVAIDGRTGKIAWRADGPAAGSYTGARTGAATVWAPPGLFTAGTTILAAGARRLAAYDAVDGRVRWRAGTATDCTSTGFATAGGEFACGTAGYDAATGAPLPGFPAAPATPLGCDVARSGCGGARDASGRGWLTTAARPGRAPALDAPGTTVAAGLALSVSGPTVSAARWHRTDPGGGPVQVLGGGNGRICLLTADRRLVILNAGDGTTESSFPLAVGTERTDWIPGRWQVTDGWVAVERLDDPDPASVHHYFTVETVVIAAG